MRLALSFLLAAASLSGCGTGAQEQRAKTEDGKDAILEADGTWSDVGKYTKDKNATLAYTGKRGTFAMYLVPDTWKKLDEVDNEDAEVEFDHKDGDVYAMIIAERIMVPLNTLKKIAFDNIRALDESAKIAFEEKRTVNGKNVLCLTIEATVEGIPFTYHNYYYSGDEGSFQVMTFTGRNLFKEYKPEMEAFLNGFEIVKKKD
ncbi:MAG: hypothetical protein KY476_02875 [Planctomycetes bacterium]|nr:hypothetical protein [Planctomycetota bacterium]